MTTAGIRPSGQAPPVTGKGADHGRLRVLEPYDLPLLLALLVAFALSFHLGENLLLPRRWLLGHVLSFLAAGVTVLVLLAAFRLLAQSRRQQGVLTRTDLRTQLARHFHWIVLLRLARFCVAVEVMATIYTVLKQRIPRLNGNNYDAELIALEKLVHLGANPAWDLARLDWPAWAAVLLDQAYLAWFPAKLLVLGYAFTSAQAARRDRFLLAYMALWITGVLGGLGLPSNGPFYISPEHFPLAGMERAASIQHLLASHYDHVLQPGGEGRLVYGWGLMALPSLHVAAVSLYVLAAWHEGVLARCVTVLFAALIFAGSLVSGWHYALDGYAAVLLAAGVWLIAGVVVKRWQGGTPGERGPSRSPGAVPLTSPASD